MTTMNKTITSQKWPTMSMKKNSVSEPFRHNHTNLNHIIPLDFNNISNLPNSHTWKSSPDEHRLILDCTQEIVLVINLEHPQAPKLIRHAYEEWGVFQLTNHGIPITIMHEIEKQTRRLFALLTKHKLLAVRSLDGLNGYDLACISAFFQKLMWSEGFTIIGSPEQDASKLWQHDHTHLCSIMEEYQKLMKGLSQKIIRLMLMSLGLPVTKTRSSLQAQSALQLNSYPVCPDPDRAMGLAPHNDSSLLTLLYQGNVSGLQVLKENLGWVPVEPVSDSLVVNVGDLMHITTNSLFRNVLHRAAVNRTRHRISVAYFYNPPKNTKISPLIKLTDVDHPPLYRAVTWEEYLDAKATHFNKALDWIRCEKQI
ncbi:LOW QUALITY PROTEIN: gibberellin 3-beta-dioxygenase 3-like [Carica papaya]|uniref:LOW QUALITY PROTEIN: gibberellin 3-beta-dioxygenase 3-like n=1 Tax=Carica papaya TaxID=3649 RepID=UPI000B8CCB70|nr:LOW QUALITY PROTEIN: gibberellin 3-beta-dioxygenase 3-like [Carica papaya]